MNLRHSNPALFFSKKEKETLCACIQEAEKKTSAEIRIHLIKKTEMNPIDQAKICFEKLGMTQTAERNGVLILIVTHSHQFAVIGDKGIHEKLPVGYWDLLVQQAEEHLVHNEFSVGLCKIVTSIGEQLAHFFPIAPGDKNELADEISYSL